MKIPQQYRFIVSKSIFMNINWEIINVFFVQKLVKIVKKSLKFIDVINKLYIYLNLNERNI